VPLQARKLIAGLAVRQNINVVLLRHVDPAIRSARLGDRPRIEDEKVAKAMSDVKSRLVACATR
jgi:hypothetical protein